MKLNIGAGGVDLPGFTPIDRKCGREAFPLKEADCSVEEIYASHVLEHFRSCQVPEVLKDWVRVLKPGGRLRVAVPDFERICNTLLAAPQKDRRLIYAYAYGGQTDDDDFHKSGFDEGSLRGLLRWAGLQHIRYWTSDAKDCASLPISLNLEGTKPIADIKCPEIRAVMSLPRLGFTENHACAVSVFQRLGIDIVKHTGVFWGQCLDRVITAELEAGFDGWFVVLDYDTVFNGAIFGDLCYLMATHPAADAIAPWQAKRECDHVLFWATETDGSKKKELTVEDLQPGLLPVDTAHFGLTLLRSKCFETLKRPWLLEVPDDDGRWGDDRIDPDIYFWNNWRESGHSLFIATDVSIGHCQQMVTWPDRRLKPIHQFLHDFQRHGPPDEARLF